MNAEMPTSKLHLMSQLYGLPQECYTIQHFELSECSIIYLVIGQ